MKITKKDGTLGWKVQICESVRKGKKVSRRVVRHIGTAHREEELERFQRLAASIIESEIADKEQANMLFDESGNVENNVTIQPRNFLSEHVIEEKRVTEGPKEIFGTLFDELGLDKVLESTSQSEVLKQVVTARLMKPASKRKTQEILERDLGFEVSLDRIYRMLTALADKESELKKAVFSQTASLFENKIDVVFFDVTTLYFESVDADELREFGYSKDQKFHSVQTVLALATTGEGLPIGYKLFPGNTAEAKTLIACLNEWKAFVDIGHVVFVADRAMFAAANLYELQTSGFEFIVAAPLRKMNKSTKDIVLSEDGYRCNAIAEDDIPTWFKSVAHTVEYRRKDESGSWLVDQIHGQLICTFNRGRACKDAGDRNRIIEKMNKLLAPKGDKKADASQLVSNTGYKKYARLEGKKLASVDEEKVQKDAEWDGMHGLFSNSKKPILEILARYRGLWTIEDSFRLCKNDLEMRPVFHFTPNRIKAHIAVCYLAFTISRHLQHRLRTNNINVSLARIKEELRRVQSSILFDRNSGQRYKLPSRISETAQKIYDSVGVTRKLTLIRS